MDRIIRGGRFVVDLIIHQPKNDYTVTSLEIIKYINTNFPQIDLEKINNLSDLKIGSKIELFNQYIFGVTPPDLSSSSSIRHYEDRISKALGGHVAHLEFRPWPFTDDEVEELKAVLIDLSNHYQAKLDVNRMVKELNLKKARWE